MRQVEVFKVNTTGAGGSPKLIAKVSAAKSESPKPAGVAASTGHSVKKDEFEEF